MNVREELIDRIRVICYWVVGLGFFDMLTEWSSMPWLLQVLRMFVGVAVCWYMIPLSYRAVRLLPRNPTPWTSLVIGSLTGIEIFVLTIGAPF